ncbi:hypothetical protein QQF64_020305 [Cirrhinus molitorella]|uniref:Integrase catalytic domain-containing protein n=1 Tax=Cirrhinus molitorella TaxID=172907 RepID=A0ABR3LAC6_9TELE
MGVCEILGIKRSLCAPYHPQTNGLVERLNGTIQRSLSKLVGKEPHKWSDYLEATMFGLCTKKTNHNSVLTILSYVWPRSKLPPSLLSLLHPPSLLSLLPVLHPPSLFSLLSLLHPPNLPSLLSVLHPPSLLSLLSLLHPPSLLSLLPVLHPPSLPSLLSVLHPPSLLSLLSLLHPPSLPSLLPVLHSPSARQTVHSLYNLCNLLLPQPECYLFEYIVIITNHWN